MAEVCRQLEITQSTWHRWRKELEKENVRLKRIVANQALDNDMLRYIAEEF